MATHSSILVWRIPWTEETGRLFNLYSLHYFNLLCFYGYFKSQTHTHTNTHIQDYPNCPTEAFNQFMFLPAVVDGFLDGIFPQAKLT